jgi:hypothetical protein
VSGSAGYDSTRRDDPALVKRDLSLLWIDARVAESTMKRRPDADVAAADGAADAVVDRVESELHGEATRYRRALWACVAVCIMPVALAGFLWSGMYWLPVRIMWTPFERGTYGLPLLSLYEWLAYLLLAVFLVYGCALIAESSSSTHRLSADYRRLADADADGRIAFARSVVRQGLDRTSLVMHKSKVFSAYASLLDAWTADPAGACSTLSPAEADAAEGANGEY